MEVITFYHKVILLLLVFKSKILFAQVPAFGKCPELNVAENFNLEKYLGLWYEAEKYPFVLEVAGKCVTATYGKMDNGDISVINRQINRFTIDTNYWILGTDYTTFAVVYSCRDIGGLMSGKMVWILTRDQNPDLAVLQTAYAVLDRKKITKAYLLRTDQFNCNSDGGV